MSSTGLTALFDGLLDDAAMFPPEDAPLAAAVAGHAAHRLAWYSDLVASFVCAAGRLPSLSAQLALRAIPAAARLAGRAGWHRRGSGSVGRRVPGPAVRRRRAGGPLRHDSAAARAFERSLRS